MHALPLIRAAEEPRMSKSQALSAASTHLTVCSSADKFQLATLMLLSGLTHASPESDLM